MNEFFTTACVQNCASLNPKETTDRAEVLIRDAAAKGADLICTPEFFSCLDTQLSGLTTDPHTEETHPALPRFRKLVTTKMTVCLTGLTSSIRWETS